MAVSVTQHATTNQKVSSDRPENKCTCGADAAAEWQQNGSSIITRRWETKLPGLSKENLANLEGATSALALLAATCQRFSFLLTHRRMSFMIFFHFLWCFIMWCLFFDSLQCVYLICWMWSLGARQCWKSVPIFTLSETDNNALFDQQVIQKTGSRLLIPIHHCETCSQNASKLAFPQFILPVLFCTSKLF